MRSAFVIPSLAVCGVSIAIIMAAFETPTTLGQVLALEGTAPLTGNQNFGGNLGIDFVVNLPVEVTALGVFDLEQNGIATTATLEVAIWERNDNGTPDVFSDDTGAADGRMICPRETSIRRSSTECC